jgi:hypothetical protein
MGRQLACDITRLGGCGGVWQQSKKQPVLPGRLGAEAVE